MRQRFSMGQRIQENLIYGRTQQLIRRAFQEFLSGAVHQRNAAIQAGRDQAAADRLNDVFVQDLEVLQSAAGIFQLHARLTKLGGEQAREISNSEVGKQVYENY